MDRQVPEVCAHGSLKRSCQTCEFVETISRLTAENERLREERDVLRERQIKDKELVKRLSEKRIETAAQAEEIERLREELEECKEYRDSYNEQRTFQKGVKEKWQTTAKEYKQQRDRAEELLREVLEEYQCLGNQDDGSIALLRKAEAYLKERGKEE